MICGRRRERFVELNRASFVDKPAQEFELYYVLGVT